MRWGLFLALFAGLWPLGAAAQDLARVPFSMPLAQTGIVVIDMERLFAESDYGEQVSAEVQRRSAALQAENDRLAGELEQEVAALTLRRQELEPEAFRAEAAAFDLRVQKIRAEQDAKEAAVSDFVSTSQERFLASVSPLLTDLMRARGASVIMEQRQVFLADPALDITGAAIAAVDAELASGTLKIPELAP